MWTKRVGLTRAQNAEATREPHEYLRRLFSKNNNSLNSDENDKVQRRAVKKKKSSHSKRSIDDEFRYIRAVVNARRYNLLAYVMIRARAFMTLHVFSAPIGIKPKIWHFKFTYFFSIYLHMVIISRFNRKGKSSPNSLENVFRKFDSKRLVKYLLNYRKHRIKTFTI